MDENELAGLQDESTWEFADGRPKPAGLSGQDSAGRTRKARAVVSVAFPAADFERITNYAQEHALSVSEVIRLGALALVAFDSRPTATGSVTLVSAGGAVQMTAYFAQPSDRTGAVLDADFVSS